MNSDSGRDPDATTRALVASAGTARARVAADIRELARELTVDELKERALDAAERSVETIAARALRRLAAAPRGLVRAARLHPVATGVVAVGVTAMMWRAARRHH
jgi:hypothetical protein